MTEADDESRFFLIFAESFEGGVIFGVGGAGRLEDQPVSEEPGKESEKKIGPGDGVERALA